MGRIVYALIGAVVSVVCSFIPFSTVLGGAVAGFLEGPNGRNGIGTGALSGLLTLLPLGVVGVLLLSFLGLGLAAFEGVLFLLLVFAFVATLLVLYTVGASALGGFLGATLAREYPETWVDVRDAIGSPVDRRREFGDAGYEYVPTRDRLEDDRDRDDDRREYERFDR